MRKAMVEKDHSQLSVRRQCELLAINRNRLEAVASPGIQAGEEEMAKKIDRLHLDHPELGARRISYWLSREGLAASRRQVRRLMRWMGLEAVYCRPNTSKPEPGHRIYPYLLRHLEVAEADQVWCADITYIPMARGFAYLVAIMDWKSRAVLAWKLSNTLDGAFCVDAFQEALQRAGLAPGIFNTDQGSQFTSQAWLEGLEQAGVRISMDGKGRWMDNVFIERLWRSVKHEGVYLWAYDNLHDLERALARWFEAYNRWKPHKSLGYQTPWQAYRPQDPVPWSLAA
jgi:putative transposase